MTSEYLNSWPPAPPGSLAKRLEPITKAILEGKIKVELRLMDAISYVAPDVCWTERPSTFDNETVMSVDAMLARIKEICDNAAAVPAAQAVAHPTAESYAPIISQPQMSETGKQQARETIEELLGSAEDSGLEDLTPGRNPWLD